MYTICNRNTDISCIFLWKLVDFKKKYVSFNFNILRLLKWNVIPLIHLSLFCNFLSYIFIGVYSNLHALKTDISILEIIIPPCEFLIAHVIRTLTNLEFEILH